MKNTFNFPTQAIRSYSTFLFSFLVLLLCVVSCGPTVLKKTSQTAKSTSHIEKSADPFLNATWKIDGNAFLSIEKESYSLSEISKKEKTPTKRNFEDRFGHFVTFDDKGGFYGHYTAPCGMDCFTSIHGSYKLLPNNRIEIFVTHVDQDGYCSNDDATKIKNKTMGTFEIIPQPKNNYLLKRL